MRALPDLADPKRGAGEIDLGILFLSVKRFPAHAPCYRNVLLVMCIILSPAAAEPALRRGFPTDVQEIDDAFDKGRSHIGSWAGGRNARCRDHGARRFPRGTAGGLLHC